VLEIIVLFALRKVQAIQECFTLMADIICRYSGYRADRVDNGLVVVERRSIWNTEQINREEKFGD